MLDPLIQKPNMVTGVWKRFAVHIFEGRLLVEDMVSIEDFGAGWYRKNPGKTVELVIIHPSTVGMTPEERTRMARVIKRFEGRRLASSTVILSTGIVGAMQRSVLTALQLLVPPPHPTRVFGTIEPAVTWLAPHVRELCGEDATPRALLGAVGDLLSRFRAQSKATTSPGETA